MLCDIRSRHQPQKEASMPTVEMLRSMFPAISACPDILLDNAGGSQVPVSVADAIRDYMISNYVQLGADYATSRVATETVDRAHEFVEMLFNAGDTGCAILGSSTSALCRMLAGCYATRGPGDRDEIIIAETAHEANAGPWARLSEHGFAVRIWPMDPETTELHLDDLRSILSARTAIVAFPHVSNILGRIEDAAKVTRLAHEYGARVVVDGVAYAPHRAMDVQELGADWYVYSTYKVFGPHMAALFGTHKALSELEGPNHYFIPRADVPYRFEPGGVSHEGCAGLLGLWPYLAALAGIDAEAGLTRAGIESAFEVIARQETELQTLLIEQLESLEGIRLIGPETSAPSRVSTISFVHESRKSRDIVVKANAKGFGIRHGHFYAHRLCLKLTRSGLLHDVEDGVVRVSMLHYNTEQEIRGLIACLREIIS
jgi:cysteine desulfurase family protein (TIGR01976 family)